VNPVEALRAE